MDITKENLADAVSRLPECCKKNIMKSRKRYTGFMIFDHFVIAGVAWHKSSFCDEATIFTTARIQKILQQS